MTIPPGYPKFQVELWNYDKLRVKSFIVDTQQDVDNVKAMYPHGELYIVKYWPIYGPTEEIEE
jgi:hypothetical protein